MNRFSAILVVCLSSVCLLLAFKSPTAPAKKSYQHLFIIYEHPDLDRVFISVDGKDYSYQKRLKKESQGDWDMNPLINLIHQYEAEGWELQSIDQGAQGHCWMRREIQH